MLFWVCPLRQSAGRYAASAGTTFDRPLDATLRVQGTRFFLALESRGFVCWTDAESTFVAGACECGVAVRHDGAFLRYVPFDRLRERVFCWQDIKKATPPWSPFSPAQAG